MNKDEAVRCVNIAKRSIAEGNKEKAEKFLSKSIALHDTKEARDLLKSLSSTPHNTVHSSKPPGAAPSPAQETSRNKDCTPEMVAAVDKVKGKKDYYAILGCEKAATDAQLKKRYRKLALALHPDKNSAAGANEAFKAVGNAYAVLSSEDKRARYDKYGLDDDGPSPRHRHGHRHNYNEEDISPEDLFNMFFGGMQPTNRRQDNRHFTTSYTTTQRNTAQDNGGNAFTSLIQMSPLLLLVLMSVLNSIFTEEPAWSYHRNGHYKIEKATAWNHIRYFVKGDFSEKYSGQKTVHLEYDIERDYKQELQIKCINNQRRKEQLMYQYRVSGNKRYRDYADAMDLQPCTDYNNFKLPQYINSPP